MANFLEKLMMREDEMTPRINALQRDVDLDELNYQSAVARRPEIPHVRDLRVREAVSQEFTAEADESLVPETKSGVAESSSSAGWHRVDFNQPFAADTTPQVIATVENREGDLQNEGPEQESPQHDAAQSDDTSFPQFSTESPSLDGISAEEVSPADISPVDKPISEKSFDDISISGLEAAADAISIRDVRPSEPPSVSSADVSWGEISAQLDQKTFSFEEEFKEQVRQIGVDNGDVVRNLATEYLDFPVVDIGDDFADMWDELMTIIWGANSQTDNASGESTAESAFGGVGAVIDSSIKVAFDERAEEVLNGFEGTNDELEAFVDDNLTPAVNDLGQQTDTAITTLNTGVQDELVPALQENQDKINEMKSRIETEINDNFGLIEDQTQGNAEKIQDPVNELVSELQDALDATNEDLITLSENFNGSISEINTALEDISTVQNEAIQAALDDFGDNVGSALEDISDENDAALNEVITLLQEAIDAENEVINQSYQDLTALSQNAIDQAPARLYEEIGAPDGQLITPVQVRNIDNTGFEFLGYEGGTKINWTATGLVQGEAEDVSPQPQPEGMAISGPNSVAVDQSNTWTAVNLPEGTDNVEWAFGDGSTGAGESVSKTYGQTGTYTIQASAISGGTVSSSDTLQIEVVSGDGGEEEPQPPGGIELPGIIYPIFQNGSRVEE